MQAYQADRAALAAAILARQLEAQHPLGPAQPITALLTPPPPHTRQNPGSNDQGGDSPLAAASQTHPGISAELSAEVVWRPALEHGLEPSRAAPGEQQVWPEKSGGGSQLQIGGGEYLDKDSEEDPEHQQQNKHASRQLADPADCSADHESGLESCAACASPGRGQPLLEAAPHSPDRDLRLSAGPPLLSGAPRSPSCVQPLIGAVTHSPDMEQPLKRGAPHSLNMEEPVLGGAPCSPNREQPNLGAPLNRVDRDQPLFGGPIDRPDWDVPLSGDPPDSPDRGQPLFGVPLDSPDREQTIIGGAAHSKKSQAKASAGVSPGGGGEHPGPSASQQATRPLEEGPLPSAALVQGRSDCVHPGQGTETDLLHWLSNHNVSTACHAICFGILIPFAVEVLTTSLQLDQAECLI